MDKLTVMVMGTQEKTKKSGEKFYQVDLYLPGVGAFDKTVDAGTFVALSKLPPATPVELAVTLAVQEEKVNLDGGRSFSVRRLGIRLGDLNLTEGRKAS